MKHDTTALKDRLSQLLGRARRSAVLIFVLFLVIVYSFLAWRIIALNQLQPDPALVSSKLKTAGVPHIDEDALAKIQQLQDNSVQVRTLFDTARSSPFQE